MAEGSATSRRDADAPNLSDVDEVWLGSSTSMPGEQFVRTLETVEEFQTALREVKAELDTLDTGLDREDAVALLFGRNHSMTKTQVRSAFEVMDAVIAEDPADIAPRLLADQTSDLTIAEAAEVWDEMVNLAEKYGAEEDDD